jgi:DNA-binding response OmpR family regulator
MVQRDDIRSPHPAMRESERMAVLRPHIVCLTSGGDFLDFLRGLLEDEDFNVTTTNYVPRSFDLLAALQPDLIMLDLIIAKRSGWDLLEALGRSARTSGIPVIITSTDRGLLADAQANPERFGGDAFVSKPFAINELLNTINRLLAMS